MNPLDQLQPLQAPPPIVWWPPAPGWWGVALLVLLLLAVLIRRYQKRAKSQKPTQDALSPVRLAALQELAALPRPYDGQAAELWLQQLNALLKRLSRLHYPQQASHTLSGRAWLAFLDNRCPAAGLTRWMILVEGAYRPNCQLDDKAIDGLNQAIEIWIRKHV
jgi:MYXO-CTERM domain-containing protein